MSVTGRWKNTGSVSKTEQEEVKKAYQSNYDEKRQKAIFDEAEKKRKSIEERLSSDRFLTTNDRRQLQRDIYSLGNMSQTLASLGVVSKDYVDHVKTLQKLKGDASRFFSSFKDENEYFAYKYNGATTKDIDDAIGAKNPFDNKGSMLGKFKIGSASDKDTKELDWLINNRDSFMTPEEIKAEIQRLEGNTKDLDYQKTRSFGLGLNTYEQDKENADKNAKRLNELKNLYASHPDVTAKDLETAYKQSDNSFFDIFRKDYSYSDYKNDKASERIYAEGYYAKKEQEELAKINSDKRSYKVLGINYTADDLFNSYYDVKEKLDSGYYDNKDDYGQARYEAERFLNRAKTALLQGGYDFKNTYDAYSRAKNREFTETLNQDARNAIDSGAFGATVANVGSVITNIAGGVQSVPESIKGAIKDASTDSPYIIDTNSSAWIAKNATDAVRTATSEVIANGKTGKIGEFLYQTGMSTADFLTITAATGFNPTASLMLMGTTAAADAVKQTSLKGGTATDAIVMGVISGGLEILLEKTPIDEIFKSVNTKSGRDAIKNVFSAMMSEGFEEFGSEIGNTVADLLINADQSDFKQRMFELMNTGMSSNDAALKVFGETMGNAALSFLGGALSGGAMAGAGNAFALYDRSKTANNNGDALLNLAKEMAGTSDIQETIDTTVQPKKTITDEDVINGMSAGRSLEPTRASVTSSVLDNDINANTLNEPADGATQSQSIENNDVNTKEYLVEYSKAVFDGVLGKKNKDIINSKILSIEQYNKANSMGVAAKNSKVDGYDIVHGISSTELKNGVTNAYANKKLSKHTKEQLSILDAYGKEYGISFVVTDTIGKGKSNGYYVGDNKIVISLDADAGALLSVAGHEIYHYIENSDSETASIIKTNIIENLKIKGFDYEGRINELKEIYDTDNISSLEAEIVGNAFFDVIGNEDTIKSLAKGNNKVLKCIVEAINSFIDKISKAVKTLHWKEADVLSEDKNYLKAVRIMCETTLKGIDESKRNTTNLDGKNSIDTDISADIEKTLPESLKNSYKQYKDIQRELEKTEAKYEDLKRANEELKKQLKYSRGRAITMNDAKNIAAEAISKYASTVKSTTLGKKLFDLFQWIEDVEGTDDFAWDFVMDTLIGEAQEVIRNQDYYEDVEDYFLDIKREIQGTRFRLSEDIWHNTNDARSPYNRRAYGKFEVARYDDMSVSDLSEQWAAWEGMFGGPFVGVSDGEMPDRLLEIWDMCTTPTYYDMVEINGYPDAETAAVALAHDMFEMYLESPSYQTYADKQKARREELKAQVKHYKSLVSSVKKEMGKEYTKVKNQRDKLEKRLGLTEEKLKEISAEYKKTKDKLGRRDATLEKTKSELKETKAELKQAQHKEDLRVRAKMRNDVKARIQQLYKRFINPKPGAYIPDELKPMVVSFFDMFNAQDDYVKPEMMAQVKEAYAELGKDEKLSVYYDPDMLENLSELIKFANDVKSGKRLYKFDAQTTLLFENLADHLFKLVSDANKTFIEGKKVEFDAVIADAIESYSKPMDKKIQTMFKMTNWNSTPYYFFKRLGGTFNKVYKDLMIGQHKSGLMLQQAKNEMSVIREKYNASSWMRDTERSIKVDTSYKEHLEFTVGEALGIYAVAKREASTPYKETNHLRGNGIIFTDKKGKDNRGIANHQLSDADVRKIVGQLTDEQIAYADDVIKYMSTTVAEWGNEISEQLHGYKKFTETAYYPYNVSDYEKSGSAMSADKPDDIVPLIKNRSHTRATVQGAQAAVKVEDFVKVANDHIKSMIDYHCLSIPQSVLNSIYSYKKGGKAITQMLDMNYDKTSSVYVKQFIKDISLGSAIDINEKIIQKLLGKFKKNAVAMNVRVIVQQPSAIGRAMALVDPKYFLTKARNPSAGYEELKRYSGVAVIKEIGGFDIATGYGITNWIMQAPPENFKDKVKTFFNPKDSTYRDEIFGMGAQKADEITWVHIWEAVKKETADKNPSLKGEDLMINAGLRFNEVIEATQVYDSVLARSQVMRSKTNTMKTLTSFMAEPTKRINMLYDAAYDFINGKDKKAAGKFLARTCGAIIVSAVLNSILKAPITAGRDDDETKSYIDKLLYALMNESMSDLSVLQGLPFIKDIISMLQGYDPSAGGMSLFNDLIDSFTGLIKPDKDAEEWKDAIVNAVGSLGAFAGVPAKNIMRDVEALMRIGVSIFDDKKPSKQSAKFSVLDGFVDMFEVRFGYSNYNPLGFMKPSEQDVYEAMLNGEDGEYELEFDKLQAYLIYGGKSSEEAVDAIESKIRDLIKENFNNGSIDWATAEKLLLEYFPDDMEEHAAYWKLREWQAKAQNPDKSSFSKYDDLSNAILSGSNLEGAIDELISHGTDSDAIETKILNVIKNAYFNDDIDLKKAEELLRKCMEYDKGNDDLALSVQDDTDVKRKLDIWENSKDLPDGETYSPFDMLNAEIVAGKPLSDEAKQKLYDLDYKDSDIKAQIPKALKEAFLNGDIDIKEAEKLLRGYSDGYGFKEKDIRRNLDVWENSKDLPKGETYSVWNKLETAVAEGKPITKEQRDKFAYLEYDDSTVNSHITKVIKEGYEEGTITRKAAEKRLLDYKVIDINDYQDSDNPTEAANKAAANKVKVWDFKREHPESDLTNDNVILDYVEAADNGVTLDVFEKYYSESSNCKGVDADGDGKTDSGSKKKQILEVINALPLTPAQKDILYFQNGWSAKTLYKDAPWH